MPDKKTILKTIDGAYRARAKGDKTAVARYLAPGAKFRLAANPKTFKQSGSTAESVNALIDQFQFTNVKRMDTLVDGNTAAVVWKVKTTTPAGKSATVELFDLWKFNKAGKVTSLLQFSDTATLASLL